MFPLEDLGDQVLHKGDLLGRRQRRTAVSSLALLVTGCLLPGAAWAIDLAGTDQTVGSLSGNGTVTNSGPGAATLTAGVDNSSTLFSGTIENGAAATGLTKAGTGVLTLSGSSSYSGATR
jgi:autotransporter-associated beta strand protein